VNKVLKALKVSREKPVRPELLVQREKKETKVQ
jgi:hypothetical protein